MTKKLSLLILFTLPLMLFISCGGSDNSGDQGVLQSPRVSKTITSTQTVQSNQTSKEASMTELELMGWETYTLKNLTISAGHVTGGGTTKVEFCMLDGTGNALGSVIGSGVKILDEAKCMYVNITSADGMQRYMVGLTQVRIPCHAAESCIFMDKWILSSGVKRVDTSYRPAISHTKAGNKRDQ